MKSLKKHISRTDIGAAIVFCIVALVLVLSALFSHVIDDEAFYYTIPQRLLQGDRLLVDEWHPTQLAALFQLLPYSVFKSLAHGTDGIILSMRLMYVCIILILYWYMYLKLREYGIWGSIASAMFCADSYLGLLAINYYNLFSVFLSILGMMVFMSRKKPSRFKLFAAGVILSCAVLCAPAFAVFYFLFSVLVFAQLLMRRKGKTLFKDHFSLLNGKAWTYLTVGVVLSATVFLLYLLAFSDVKSILFDVGFLRGSSSHSMTIFGNSLNYNKFKNYIVENSFILLICALIMISAVVYCCLRKHFRSSRVRRGVRAFLLIAVFAVFSVFLFVNLNRMFDTEGFGNNTIISVLSFVVFLLCDRKDRRMLAFFCLSLACSFSMDFLSNVTILFGSRLAYIPAFCCIGTVLRELRQIPDDQKDDLSSADNGLNRFFVRLGYVFSAAFIAALSLWIILWSNYLLFDAGNSPTSMTMIERGPYAGLIRKQNYCDDYFSSLDELDCIAQTGDGPVYISAMLPFGYLYMDRPIGICTTYYESEDELLRAMEYWEMYPEKRPSVIYIPKYSFDKDGFIARNDQAKNDLEKLNDLCVSSYEETDTGIVLSAVQWLPSFNAEKSG